MEYSLGQFGFAVLAVSPPKVLSTPLPTGERVVLEKQLRFCGSAAQQH